MTELIYVRYTPEADEIVARVRCGERAPVVTAHRGFGSLVASLFQRGSQETDVNSVTVVALDPERPAGLPALDQLSLEEQALGLKFLFAHLNLVVVLLPELADASVVEQLTKLVQSVDSVVTNRISRVEAWTETGPSTAHDLYARFSTSVTRPEPMRSVYDDVVASMSFVLSANSSKSTTTLARLQRLKAEVTAAVNFEDLLVSFATDPLRKPRLCHAVGFWGFPAHELSNDDLVYCVYLMLKHALVHVPAIAGLEVPSDNELLALVFAVRDTYRSGNPFHNFRHAVDVVQACFHFLVRLGCLPRFTQFNEDASADALPVLNATTFEDTSSELCATTAPAADPLLNPVQSLALLVAALGHDVGHPGVTNAFMIKYQAPISLIVNERSVLESYHNSVFINKILAVNWPSLLATDTGVGLSVRELVTSAILATDMAEHFEYMAKLNTLKHEQFDHDGHKVKLVSSLLIKCADISNVTRPLRVSSQWAFVLARETEEIATLEKKLTSRECDLDLHRDLVYTRVPSCLDDILSLNDQLYKGQIFFIDTFAENLFHNIAEFLPQLSFAEQIVQKNKSFWLNV
ncbi:3',5'-cyclic-nucleotide phosphodiesterase 2 [Diutina catenulata]